MPEAKNRAVNIHKRYVSTELVITVPKKEKSTLQVYDYTAI